MILEQSVFREPGRSVPKVIGIFSFRYDAQLVPALLENIRPLVHGVVSCDDRGSGDALSDEPARRNALIASARDMGADWILAVDPDERFETAFASRITEMTSERHNRVLWTFWLREMFSETAYRTDGIWGGKTQMRLFPASATTQPLDKALHGRWIADQTGYRDVQSGINLYHLRHVSPKRAQHRRDTYAAADPQRDFHPFGYDYLVDMRGARLREISPKRGFLPAHVDDHELWALPTITALGEPMPDPPDSRLRTIARTRRSGGTDGASYLAQDVLAADKGDDDIALVAASLALQAGRPKDALTIIGHLGDRLTALGTILKARALARLGEEGQAKQAFASARAQAGPPLIIEQVEQSEFRQEVDLTGPDALWRRWCGAGPTLREGAANGTGPLCIIIIGYRAPKSLAEVVAAARSQSDETEIVVVNSGGGDAAALLSDHLFRIRLIDVPERLFVGPARNIGIDASRGAYVSFLADDCVPLPGWVQGRIAHHEAGELMVASAVVPESPDSVLSHVARTLVFSKRAPTLSEDEALPYGRSYHRSVFTDAGYFAKGLRIGEDTEFNRRADILAPVVWAPEIVVRHLDPNSTFGFLRDIQKRAQRFASYIRPKGGSPAGQDWIGNRVAELRERVAAAYDQASEQSIWFRLRLRIILALCVQANRVGYRRADRFLGRAEALAEKAKTLAATDPAQAISLLREALALSPHDGNLHIAMGALLRQKGDETSTAQALASFETASNIAPTDVFSLRDRAELLIRTHQRQHAIEICESAVIVTPQTLGILMMAATMAKRLRNPTLAVYFAQSALVADVSNIRPHSFLERLHREAGNIEMADRRKAMFDLLQPRT